MSLHIRSRRSSRAKILREFDDPLILDVTSKGLDPWVRFSPFYPHGGIPVPFSPGLFAQSVEGIWQGLTVFESSGIDKSKFEISNMRGIERTVRKFGEVRGHQLGTTSDQLLTYRDARGLIYLPTFEWVLRNRVADLVAELRSLIRQREVILLDYSTSEDLLEINQPLSHAGLIRAFVNLSDESLKFEFALTFLWAAKLVEAQVLESDQCKAIQWALSRPPQFANVFPIRYPGTWDPAVKTPARTPIDWKLATKDFVDSVAAREEGFPTERLFHDSPVE